MKENNSMLSALQMMKDFTDEALEPKKPKKSKKWKPLSTAPKDREILLALKHKFGYSYVVAQWSQVFEDEDGDWAQSGVKCREWGDDSVEVDENTLWTEIPD